MSKFKKEYQRKLFVEVREVILTFLDTLFVRSQKASKFFFYWERTWLMHSGAGCIETKYQNKNACVLAFLTEPYLTQLHCTEVCFLHTIWSNANGFIYGLLCPNVCLFKGWITPLPHESNPYLQVPERIYNSHYDNGVPALVLFSWKVNIAENPIAVMGL